MADLPSPYHRGVQSLFTLETTTEGGDPVKTITIRKAGAVRLTAPAAGYCYGCCCCIRAF